MEYKINVIKLMHEIYRNDPYIQSFIFSGQIIFNNVEVIITRLKNLLHFNNLDEKGCEWWEKLLIISDISSDIKQRQARIRAKWQAVNHIDIEAIQLICDSIAENSFKADFLDGKLQIIIEKKDNTGSLVNVIKEIDEIKPSHLPYLFLYMLTENHKIFANICAIESFYSEFDCTKSL